MNDLVTRHLVFGIFRPVCAQKDAHHVLPVTFFHALPDKVARETLRIIQERAEPTVLAQGEVADIMEQRIWDIAPQRPEYQVEARGVEGRVDTVRYRHVIHLNAGTGYVDRTYNKFSY